MRTAHRQLLTAFLPWLGGEVRAMGPTTRAFYGLYRRAERMESIVLVNLMFETIGPAAGAGGRPQ